MKEIISKMKDIEICEEMVTIMSRMKEEDVEKMESFQLIGIEREFSLETSYQELPKFWDEFIRGYCAATRAEKAPETALEQAVCQCSIGEFGVCIDSDASPERFRYLIAGRYNGRAVPEGMTVYTLPALEWARFRCSGPMPEALQSVKTKIFQEWLPGNPASHRR